MQGRSDNPADENVLEDVNVPLMQDNSQREKGKRVFHIIASIDLWMIIVITVVESRGSTSCKSPLSNYMSRVKSAASNRLVSRGGSRKIGKRPGSLWWQQESKARRSLCKRFATVLTVPPRGVIIASRRVVWLINSAQTLHHTTWWNLCYSYNTDDKNIPILLDPLRCYPALRQLTLPSHL